MEDVSSSDLNVRKKRLRFRAWQRGTREMDLVLGRFVDAHVEALTGEEVSTLEALMEAPDPELYLWVAGTAEVPAIFDTPVFRRIVDFHKNGPQ
jgi:antitoxin CptB